MPRMLMPDVDRLTQCMYASALLMAIMPGVAMSAESARRAFPRDPFA